MEVREAPSVRLGRRLRRGGSRAVRRARQPLWDALAPRMARAMVGSGAARARNAAVLTPQRGAGSERPPSRLADALEDRGVAVTRVPAGLPIEQLHVELAAAGPFDLLVDDSGDEAQRVAQIRATFFHVRAGGRYVVPRVGRSVLAPGDGDPARVGSLLARLRGTADPDAPGAPSGRAARDDWALARAIESADVGSGCLVLVSRSQGALAKLDEPQASRFIELRDAAGTAGPDRPAPARIAARRSGRRFETRCDLHQNTTELRLPYEPVYISPDLVLRDLPDVLCAPGQVVAYDNVLMPDTYRHNRRDRLHNPYAPQLSHHFARVGGLEDAAPRRRSGTFFHFDNEERGHFGHAMTEQMSRLWALSLAREIDPDLKILVGVTKGRSIKAWERELWEAAGITRDQMVAIRRPVRVERLLTATPMLSMPFYVHPDIEDVWRTVGDSLVARAPERDYPERVFCSRPDGKRECRNRAEVEELFAGYGFTVLRPEQLSLPEQARMFREAEVIAGFAGSGVFGSLWATEPKRVITVTSRRYGPTNEYLIASVLGHRLDQVFCEPDTWEYKSAYEFDFDRDGPFLREVLEGL